MKCPVDYHYTSPFRSCKYSNILHFISLLLIFSRVGLPNYIFIFLINKAANKEHRVETLLSGNSANACKLFNILKSFQHLFFFFQICTIFSISIKLVLLKSQEYGRIPAEFSIIRSEKKKKRRTMKFSLTLA